MRKTIFAVLVGLACANALADSSQLKCLTDTIYYEARSEPVRCQYNVGHVVINRTKSKHFPNTICKVVYQKSQFSWTASKYAVREHEAYANARKIAVKLLADDARGVPKDTTANSLYFTQGKRFRSTKVVDGCGKHIFMIKV